ncbi:MAG TPA: DNA-3-methyladenine glycosylase I [Gemmatimonadaceae bacterium]
MSDAFDTSTIPDVIDANTLGDYFEVMTRAVFQAGVSWAQIARHWNAYRRTFADFDVVRVAAYGDADIDAVLAEPGILRMRRKAEATVKNARSLLDVQERFGTFHDYAASFDSYQTLARDIKKRFSFMGDMNAWYMLFRVREPVPCFDDWVKTIPGDHPRMREMVEHAREVGRSSER